MRKEQLIVWGIVFLILFIIFFNSKSNLEKSMYTNNAINYSKVDTNNLIMATSGENVLLNNYVMSSFLSIISISVSIGFFVCSGIEWYYEKKKIKYS